MPAKKLHGAFPPLERYDRRTAAEWFRARRSRTTKLGAPPWVLHTRRFRDPSDPAVHAVVVALHIAEGHPWLVQGVLRADSHGALLLQRVAVEHLTDPDIEVGAQAMRLPVATLRDRARFWLQQNESETTRS